MIWWLVVMIWWFGMVRSYRLRVRLFCLEFRPAVLEGFVFPSKVEVSWALGMYTVYIILLNVYNYNWNPFGLSFPGWFLFSGSSKLQSKQGPKHGLPCKCTFIPFLFNLHNKKTVRFSSSPMFHYLAKFHDKKLHLPKTCQDRSAGVISTFWLAQVIGGSVFHEWNTWILGGSS